MKTMICVVLWFFLCFIAAHASEFPSDLTHMDKLHPGLVNDDFEAAPTKQYDRAVDDIDWTALPNAPESVCRAAIGTFGDYIYIFGGQGSAGSNTALAFNIVAEQWENSTVPPVSGSNWNAAVANGELYVFPIMFGGAEVQKFTPDPSGPGGTWSLVTTYPENNWAFAVAWDGGNYIYCAGGSYPTTNSAYRMDLTTSTFDPLPPLPQGRGWVGGAFVNGKFYVCGGKDANYQRCNSCYEYDPIAGVWNTKAPLIHPISFTCFNIACDGELIYLVGGGGGYDGDPGTDTVQVYDPATDTWSLETNRMADYGVNEACYVAEGDYLFDCGGRDPNFVNYNFAWKGPLPGLTVTLTPHDPPIVIPAGGGSFLYDVAIENGTLDPVIADAWIDITPPGGAPIPLIMRLGITFPANSTLSRTDLTQFVPPNAPAGIYTYTGSVGEILVSVVDSDHFTFEKLAGDEASNHDYGWSLRGWDDLSTPRTSNPTDFGLFSTSPNPFNATTTISFGLPEATRVNLTIFDLSGRAVVTLADGWREAGNHEVTFDGSRLASGVYLARLEAGEFNQTIKMVLVK